MKLKSLFFLPFLLLVFLVNGQDDPKVRPGADLVGPGVTVAQQQQQATIEATNPMYESPANFFDEGILGALYAGVLAFIAYLGGFIPGVRNIKSGYVRSGAVIFVLLAGIGTFKAGVLTPEFFDLITSTFLPNFAYSGILYEAVKVILRLLGKETGGLAPTV